MAEVQETTMTDIPPIKQEDILQQPQHVLTPPASEGTEKAGNDSSDLSDVEEEDIGDVEPAYYYEGGKIPVFEPTMKQFKDFRKFIAKIDKYGMKSGIVKVVPPQEWKDSLPQLDEQVKTIKVKNPITQEFHGTHGTYTQANMEKQRSYNLPQWRALCEESQHQPPARRGERRQNQKPVRSAPGVRASGPVRTTRSRAVAATPSIEKEESPAPKPAAKGKGKAKGRPKGKAGAKKRKLYEAEEEDEEDVEVPPTPTSPAPKAAKLKAGDTPPKARGRQPKSNSVSSRRKNNRSEQADVIDEEAFVDFDYRVHNNDEWTAERCQELETAYWKSLTFNNPMYGADMPGSLFDDTTTSWNVAKLPNLLDILGQKIPGVNTAYLYLGMWKATFAWHLEDVDLYSINYIHFGAPKQWYSISQADARRFESAMKNVWPNDAKNCDQFLRHKTYLISPQILKSQYNIEVNRLVHNEGEFVITYPYGYHSGYNLGYNCAESVNFATDGWLDYGRIAKKCECEADSVWVDVWDIERKLRGEPTPEYYETDYDSDEPMDLPTPPAETGKKSKKRKTNKEIAPKPKKIKLRIKMPAAKQPCLLCPNDYHFEELLPTDNDKGQVHRRCAEYLPETYVSEGKDLTIACGINNITKARYDLRCNHCKIKHGATFQCSFKKCTRAYHATCAFVAGVQVDQGKISVYDENGTEYIDSAFDFRCRFHRHKRPKYQDRGSCVYQLEENYLLKRSTPKIEKGEIIQWQYWGTDIFAGFVLENRHDEKMILVESLPTGQIMEVEYKWILILDRQHSYLQPPSDAAKPLPAHLQHKNNAKEDPALEVPKIDEPYFGGEDHHIVAEFMTYKPTALGIPKVDIRKHKQMWYYLGAGSTEAKAQYTSDPSKPVHDHTSSFLDSVRPPLPPAPAYQDRRSSLPAPLPASYPAARSNSTPTQAQAQASYSGYGPTKNYGQNQSNNGMFIGGSNSNGMRNGQWPSSGSNGASPTGCTPYSKPPSNSGGYVYNKPIKFSAPSSTAPTAAHDWRQSPLGQQPYQLPRPTPSAAPPQTFRFREHLGYKATPSGARIPSGSSKAPPAPMHKASSNSYPQQPYARPAMTGTQQQAPGQSAGAQTPPASQTIRNYGLPAYPNLTQTQGPLVPIELSSLNGSAPVSKLIGADTQNQPNDSLIGRGMSSTMNPAIQTKGTSSVNHQHQHDGSGQQHQQYQQHSYMPPNNYQRET